MSVPLEFDFCRIFLRYFSLLTVESHPGESSNTRSCFMLSKTGSAMAGWVTWFEYKFYLPLLSAEHQRQLQLNLKYLFLEVVPKFLW